ncbi:MAG: peptidoglycan bridge formation glycyltransferase FemA/FemB family protein [Candidatus Falkowbacteria bacterium]
MIDQFLQSNLWCQFQKKSGYNTKVFPAGFFVEKNILRFKKYLYGPRISSVDNLIQALPAEFKDYIFVRFDAVSDFKLPANGSVVKTIDVQPSQTIILDLVKSEAELLAAMHPKTRYNIRLAEKKGVKIFTDNNRVDEFLCLLKITTERDTFRGHDDDYYRTMLNFDPNFIKLFLAEYDGRIIAAGIFCFYGNGVTYMHGASDNNDRSVMAPYLLQWHLIAEAKKYGYKYYDFYGISEIKWPGVTRFKKGFGGEVVNYPGTFDYILSPFWYKIYNILRRARRLI